MYHSFIIGRRVVKELVNKVEVLQAQISGSSDYNALKEAVSSSG